jgi:hypothetical protein
MDFHDCHRRFWVLLQVHIVMLFHGGMIVLCLFSLLLAAVDLFFFSAAVLPMARARCWLPR